MVAKAATALDQVLGPLDELIDIQTAEQISTLKLATHTQMRINFLADKSAEGTLSDAERAEYAEFVEAIDILSIFQARAKNILNRLNVR